MNRMGVFTQERPRATKKSTTGEAKLEYLWETKAFH